MYRRNLCLPICLAALTVFADVAHGQTTVADVQPDIEDERGYLLRKQRETFRLNIETDYANALQKLCQTGYGDQHLCLSHAPPVAPHDSADLPDKNAGKPQRDDAAHPVRLPHALRVREIFGLGSDLSAVLVLEDGRTLTVGAPVAGAPPTTLPSGEILVAVQPRQVIVRRPGQSPMSLALAEDGVDKAILGDAP